MSRKSIAYTRGYERSDFSDLLMALQTERQEMAVGAEEDQAVISAPCTEISTTEESAERHRIVSDQRIKYLYSKQDNVIHDKHCACAKNIPDEELQWSGEYVPGLQPCPDCMLQAYVSEGAKDPKEIDNYLIFFKRAKMTTEQIRDMYVGHHMKTRISTDTMTVWYRDD
ncbi:MAG: hypothetical protein Q4B26_20380, partial [Eubacteriales bacterium]|nr:hypothetical protein [Eubacteriales bacterium]